MARLQVASTNLEEYFSCSNPMRTREYGTDTNAHAKRAVRYTYLLAGGGTQLDA